MLTKSFYVLVFLAVANADLLPHPVLETTVTGESGSIREQRGLPFVPFPPFPPVGHRFILHGYPEPVPLPLFPVTSVVPETPVVEAKTVEESKDSVTVETPEVKKVATPVVVLPEHPIHSVYRYPYPYYGINGYYRYF
ncbi:uncharacterized protein LOC660532 [Tribolium castaneum]|nr:PREDICTED: uncharacterized protein LOC660532 [Tribolium castaneum]|eukprot:XP_976349.1 PREDICTED: uncharacterized protein LOC660532 [Tribolium castaneum]